ncbi:MAG: NPCBM/NEW2 domain-containing protein, partial [Thermoguttaceae bacterium]|nr:NPCBM/NEW2 domain-containing protein [Thermoguttaceae bacterium]
MDVPLNGTSDLYLVAMFGPDNYDYDQAAWGVPTLYDTDGNAVDMTTVKPVSSQTGWGTMLINKDHAGKPVKICGKTYEKAIYAHAPSILHYKLDGKYTRFTAEVGLVESAKNGTVTFEVRPDPVPYPSKAVYMKGMANAPEELKPVPTA